MAQSTSVQATLVHYWTLSMSLARVTTMCLMLQGLKLCPPLWQTISDWEEKQGNSSFQKGAEQDVSDCALMLGSWSWYKAVVQDILKNAECDGSTKVVDEYLDRIEQADVNTLISSHYRQWPGLLRPDI